MAMSDKNYFLQKSPIYKPLGPRETRRVWIRKTGKSLFFELEVVSLDVHEEKRDFLINHSYFALSYTWTSFETVPVAFKGEDGQLYPVYVTVDLVRICEYLNHCIDGDYPWWIDQLSIDQHNLDEKMSQIGMMRDIYEHSTEVIIWLIEPDGQTIAALTHIHEVAMTFRNLRKAGEDYDDAESRIRPNYLHHFTGPHTDENLERWKNTQKVLDMRWFSRLWIKQESTAHPIFKQRQYVMSGQKFILLDDFVLLFRMISNLEPWRHEDSIVQALLNAGIAKHANFISICEFWMHRTMYQHFPLMSLLKETRQAKATDPRDKIIAISHFATDIEPDQHTLEVSYRMTAEKVFINVMIWYIQKYGNLDFFSQLQRNTKRLIPDWIPDWTDPDKRESWTYYENDWLKPLVPLWCASGKENLNILRVNGDVGDVTTLQALTISGVRLSTIQLWYRKLEDKCIEGWDELKQIQCPLNNIPLAHVMSRTMVLDHTGVLRGRLVYQTRGACWQGWPPCTKEHEDCLRKFPGVPGLARQSRSAITSHSFFLLRPVLGKELGVIGVGERGFRDGDELWSLKGGKLLYILRPWDLKQRTTIRHLDVTGKPNIPKGIVHSTGSIMYQLMGECLVLGLMDGEIMDMLGDNPKRTRPACLQDMDHEYHDINILHPRLISEDESPMDADGFAYSLEQMEIPHTRLGLGLDHAKAEIVNDKNAYWPIGAPDSDLEQRKRVLGDGAPFTTFILSDDK